MNVEKSQGNKTTPIELHRMDGLDATKESFSGL
jgi:hypothetical protein